MTDFLIAYLQLTSEQALAREWQLEERVQLPCWGDTAPTTSPSGAAAPVHRPMVRQLILTLTLAPTLAATLTRTLALTLSLTLNLTLTLALTLTRRARCPRRGAAPCALLRHLRQARRPPPAHCPGRRVCPGRRARASMCVAAVRLLPRRVLLQRGLREGRP